jgi:hypothetical protein
MSLTLGRNHGTRQPSLRRANRKSSQLVRPDPDSLPVDGRAERAGEMIRFKTSHSDSMMGYAVPKR